MISIFITYTTEKVLEYVLYIYYLVYFQKYSNNAEVLNDFSSKVNTITFINILKLGVQIQKTCVKTWKTDKSSLTTYTIVIVALQVKNMIKNSRFLQKTFISVDTNVNLILKKFFFGF